MYHQTGSVPKPWTGSSVAAERRWAPIRAPTPKDPNRAPMSNSKPVAAAKPSLVVSYVSHESSPAKSKEEKSLNQALDNLETFLQEFDQKEAQKPQEAMAETMEKNKVKDDDNNNADKVLDDLTKKLMEALDTNEVVPWKSSEDHQKDPKTPFGKCTLCGNAIHGEASVVAGIHFHPKCFTCAECKEPLGTDKYYVINGKNYCSKDRLKLLEKCTKCGKLIENETIRPKESGKPYHAECFCCSKCGHALHGKFFTDDNGDMLCQDDFAASREKCTRCGRAILEAKLKALGEVYHPNCFICSMCPKSLEGVEFFVTDDNKPMCKDDYAKYVAKTCFECDEKIIDETLIATSDGRNFHRECYDSTKN